MRFNFNPLAVALGLVLASGATVRAQQTSGDTGDRPAYEAAMKCYIVAGNASLDRKKVGDTEKAEMYDHKAHAAFDLAVKFGRSLGRNGSQIEADILETQERELPKLVADVEYNRQSAGTCRALGLL